MGDVFKEQLIKRQPTKNDLLKKTGIVLAALLISAVSFFIPLISAFSVFVAAGAAFGTYYLFSFFSVEYEYIFTNGDLDVDVIYAKSRRKRVFNGNVRDFELMAHINDAGYLKEFGAAVIVKDFTSGVTKGNTYAFLTLWDGKKAKILIEPNENILQSILSILPSRKFFRR